MARKLTLPPLAVSYNFGVKVDGVEVPVTKVYGLTVRPPKDVPKHFVAISKAVDGDPTLADWVQQADERTVDVTLMTRDRADLGTISFFGCVPREYQLDDLDASMESPRILLEDIQADYRYIQVQPRFADINMVGDHFCLDAKVRSGFNTGIVASYPNLLSRLYRAWRGITN